MSHVLRLAVAILGIVVIAAPLSAVITILLLPLWSWLEASTGIESVGHSGPAEWCYLAVFLILCASGVLIALVRHRASRRRASAA
jgi:hypothetical protein